QDRLSGSGMAGWARTTEAWFRTAGFCKQADQQGAAGWGNHRVASSWTAFKRYPHVLEIRTLIHLSSDTGDLFEQSYNFAQKQVRKLVEKHAGFYPLYTQNGKWEHEAPDW